MIKCPECGIENTADSNYCRRCGAHLVIAREQQDPTVGQPIRTRVAADEAPAEHLPTEGTVLQVRYPLDREGELLGLQGQSVTIGRHPRSDLFLDDVTVSRRHACIHIAPDGYTIEDEGSLNGTYVNRRRIEIHQLFDGDEVQIGKFRLAFLEQKAGG